MKTLAASALTGCALGASLSLIGFSDYKQMYHMLSLADFRMIGAFATAVAILGTWFMLTKQSVSRRFHPGIIPGGILFGIGWALSGACPATPLVQLGEGKFWAIAIIAGIVIGIVAYRYLHLRIFKWSNGSC